MGDEEIVRLLIEKGATPDTRTTQDFTVKGQPVFIGSFALMVAADRGHAGVVNLINKAREQTKKNKSHELVGLLFKVRFQRLAGWCDGLKTANVILAKGRRLGAALF
jgi:hypothetical protein